jgi:HD-like signal output (HDOD) protein
MAAHLSLVDVINRFIESDAVTLPVFNSASSRIQQEMAKPEPSIQVIEKIITSDQTLSAQALNIANSSFYRGLAEIGTVRAAILRLGFKEIEQVVLLATSRQHFKSSDKTINLLMKKLWQHAVGCAYGTVWLARRYTYGVDQSQAFFGGLFHDVGKLLVLVIIEQVKRRNKTLKITDALLLEAMDKLCIRGKGPNCWRSGTCPNIFMWSSAITTAWRSTTRISCSCWCAWPTWSATSSASA